MPLQVLGKLGFKISDSPKLSPGLGQSRTKVKLEYSSFIEGPPPLDVLLFQSTLIFV
jgi:hypothetical protein